MENIDLEALSLLAASIADDKKAIGTTVLDVSKESDFTDYIVIVTGESTPQINAIADEIEEKFKEMGIMLLRREGQKSNSWRVIDYGGLVIHIMSPQIRQRYNIEGFWHKAKNIADPHTPTPTPAEPQIKAVETSPSTKAATKKLKAKKTVKKVVKKVVKKPVKKAPSVKAPAAKKVKAKKVVKKATKKIVKKVVKKIVKKPAKKSPVPKAPTKKVKTKKTVKKVVKKIVKKPVKKTPSVKAPATKKVKAKKVVKKATKKVIKKLIKKSPAASKKSKRK